MYVNSPHEVVEFKLTNPVVFMFTNDGMLARQAVCFEKRVHNNSSKVSKSRKTLLC